MQYETSTIFSGRIASFENLTFGRSLTHLKSYQLPLNSVKRFNWILSFFRQPDCGIVVNAIFEDRIIHSRFFSQKFITQLKTWYYFSAVQAEEPMIAKRFKGG